MDPFLILLNEDRGKEKEEERKDRRMDEREKGVYISCRSPRQ